MSLVAPSLDQICINTVRGLAIDAVQKANSGHPGLPLGAAPMAHALWTRHLKFNPRDPHWPDRDRFILSAGHGSMLLYSLLFLTGYDVSLDDLKAFRQWGSITPGHPENHVTPGVEMATGPLGQGVATSVGFAIAERFLRETLSPEVVSHFTYAICSDGDLMEGVAQEAASLAGHQKLGKLIWLYDDNRITIDGSTDLSFTDDTEARFEALGWHVQRVDGMDVDEVDKALTKAKSHETQPSLIICRTIIGYGSPNKAGTSKSHGSPLGPDEIKATKQALGLPDEDFYVNPDALASYRTAIERGAELQSEWKARVADFAARSPELARKFASALGLPADNDTAWIDALPICTEAVASRKASHTTLNAIAPHLPGLLSGCADLAESVYTDLHGLGSMQAATPTGRNIPFGVREHGMAAAVNGINLHGGLKAFGGTFLIFSDYCRPALRLAALMECPSMFAFSHDSIGLGEDGPTHQPIEQLMSLRAIPNFNVLRPADGNETAACWKIALECKSTPCALILSRQNLPSLTPGTLRDHPARFGAYVLQEAAGGTPKVILVATGSEVSLAVSAKALIEAEGIGCRVVSMPSWFLFEQQDAAYRDSVLPRAVPTVSIEAGTTLGWAKYSQVQVGIDHFGASAPAATLYKEFGLTAERIADAALGLVSGHLRLTQTDAPNP